MKTALTVPAIAALVLVGLLTAACGDSDANATAPTTPAGPQTEVFTGTLTAGGSSFYSFTVGTSGQVSITLASLVPARPGPAISAVLDLGVGTPLGTDCSVTNGVPASPALTAQLVNTLTAAIYCTRLSDPGTLTAPVNFSVRIVHP